MRRVAYGFLFLLAGILFPVLIWVALFVAMRKPLLHSMRRFASAVLALLAGIFFPILIWVGFGVAVKQWVQERTFGREPVRTVGDILAAAGLKIQWETPGARSAAAVFAKPPMSEIRELLARTGL